MINYKKILYLLATPFSSFLSKKMQFRLAGYRIFKSGNKIIYDEKNRLYKLNNMPSAEELNTYYGHSYWNHFNVPALLDSRDVLHYDYFVNVILKSYWKGDIRSSEFLNYGGAFGGICFLTAAKGIRTTNVDFTNSHMKNPIFSTIRPSDFASDSRFDNSIDFFYASHSIEHVRDLEKFMSDLHRVLKTGGMFFGEVPNAGTDTTEFVNLTGGGNGEIVVPHTYYFTRDFFNDNPFFEVLNLIEYPSVKNEISELREDMLEGDSLFFVLRKI
jgi:SAM-dependent methyltransferase